MSGLKDDSPPVHHPAFGMVGISHVSGGANLFQVDYPQQHYVVIRIKRAQLDRHGHRDWVHANEPLIEIAMSNVQFAQLITSPNHGDGVPCTLTDYVDPRTGKLIHPELEDNQTGTVERFASEVSDTAQDVGQRVGAALKEVEALLKGGPVKKSDLQRLKDLLFKADQHLSDNLEYVVKSGERTLNKAAMHAKAEIDAHIDFAMTRLGERALGARLVALVEERGGSVRDLGEMIATAVTDQREEVS